MGSQEQQEQEQHQDKGQLVGPLVRAVVRDGQNRVIGLVTECQTVTTVQGRICSLPSPVSVQWLYEVTAFLQAEEDQLRRTFNARPHHLPR